MPGSRSSMPLLFLTHCKDSLFLFSLLSERNEFEINGSYYAAAKLRNRKRLYDRCQHLVLFLVQEAEEVAIVDEVKGPTVQKQLLVS